MPSSDPDRVHRALDGLRAHEAERNTSPVPARFEIEGEIGRGGMAVVYRAHDRQLDRVVAVKVMRDDLGVGGEAEARFRREIEVTARLQHPNVVTVFDAGPNHLVMELVDGESLADRLDAGPRLSPREAGTLIAAVARGVHAAHELGIVHRDLKPSNILLPRGDDGALDLARPKVADFGVAHLAGDVTKLTVSGMVVGTPRYMAPEQVASKRRPVSASTDVYSLGAMLYEIATGANAHAGDTPMAVFASIMHADPVPPRKVDATVPTDLETIIVKALEKTEARRYASAAALADDLDAWREGRAIAARPPSLFYQLRKRIARRRGVFVTSLVGLIALVVVLVILFRTMDRSKRTLALWRNVTTVMSDAELYARAGQTRRASERIERGVADCRAFLDDDDVADAHYFLGRLYRAQRRLPDARAALDRAVALDADLVEARFERGLLLVAFYEAGLVDGALVAGQSAATSRAIPPAELDIAHPHLGRLREAAIADLAVRVNESRYVREVDVRFGRAELARIRWEWETARREYRAILDAEPLYAPACLGLAKIGRDQQDWAAAIAEASRAIEIHRGFGEAFLVRGDARFWKLEQADVPRGSAPTEEIVTARAQALEDLDCAVRLLPASGWARRMRGTLRYRFGDGNGALDDLNEAIRLAPRDALAFNLRAVVHQSASRYTDAVADFTEAVLISPRFHKAWANRAKARAMQNDMDGARHDARQALAVAPDDESVRARYRALVKFFGGSVPKD